MKKLRINADNTVGTIQFNDNDIVHPIGTYNPEYLIEALESISANKLTLGYYNDNGNHEFNLLCFTNGKTIVGVAPIYLDSDPRYEPPFPRDEIILSDIQQQLVDSLASEITTDEKFKKYITGYLIGDNHNGA